MTQFVTAAQKHDPRLKKARLEKEAKTGKLRFAPFQLYVCVWVCVVSLTELADYGGR